MSMIVRHTFFILFLLMLPRTLRAEAPATPPGGGRPVASEFREFLGEPLLVRMQKLWDKRGGWGGILTAPHGTVVAFQSPGGGTCRRSSDGGKTLDAAKPPTSRRIPGADHEGL